jgi:hypothetical protein
MSSHIEVTIGIRTKDTLGNDRHEWITDSRKITGGVVEAMEIIPEFLSRVKTRIKPMDVLVTEQVSVTRDHLKCMDYGE